MAVELMAALARIPERHATFHEQKTLAALAEPLLSSGTLNFRRPDHLEKITLTPIHEILVVDAGRLTVTQDNHPSRVLDLGSHPEIRALVEAILGTLRGDLPALTRSYTVRLSGSMARWELTLAPADARLARLVRSITIDGAATELRSIRTQQANGDESRMTITPQPASATP